MIVLKGQDVGERGKGFVLTCGHKSNLTLPYVILSPK